MNSLTFTPASPSPAEVTAPTPALPSFTELMALLPAVLIGDTAALLNFGRPYLADPAFQVELVGRAESFLRERLGASFILAWTDAADDPDGRERELNSISTAAGFAHWFGGQVAAALGVPYAVAFLIDDDGDSERFEALAEA